MELDSEVSENKMEKVLVAPVVELQDLPGDSIKEELILQNNNKMHLNKKPPSLQLARNQLFQEELVHHKLLQLLHHHNRVAQSLRTKMEEMMDGLCHLQEESDIRLKLILWDISSYFY
jgi:hypothetical protein